MGSGPFGCGSIIGSVGVGAGGEWRVMERVTVEAGCSSVVVCMAKQGIVLAMTCVVSQDAMGRTCVHNVGGFCWLWIDVAWGWCSAVHGHGHGHGHAHGWPPTPGVLFGGLGCFRVWSDRDINLTCVCSDRPVKSCFCSSSPVRVWLRNATSPRETS